MSYKKFDDANEAVSNSKMKVYDAITNEAIRRAIQGISNRIIGGSNGTQGPLITATLAAGSTAGVKTTNAVTCVINGVKVSVAALDNLVPPAGTMGSNKAAKYLLAVESAGTGGTVYGPGNVVDCADYSTNTLALAACKLPDLPDGQCALGYISIVSPYATDVVF